MSTCEFTKRLNAILNDPDSDELAIAESHLGDCEICQQAIDAQSQGEEWRQLVPELDSRQLISEASELDTVKLSDSQTHESGQSSDVDVLIPGYDILEKLGSGGLGVVYRAHHRKLNRDVALKFLNRDTTASPGAWVRFAHEAEAIAKLRHPGIIQVFDTGEHGKHRYICQELADSGSLAEQIYHQPQPPLEAAQTVLEISRAVQHSHENGILHRDLKPANVLIANGVLKLADFGLAKFLDSDEPAITRTSDVMGTPQYMSPEQAAGNHSDTSVATDVYGLGVILYEMLCGFTPFRGSTPIQTLQLVITEEPIAPRARISDVPVDLDTICLKCLQKSPGKRYPSVAALVEDLERFLSGRPIAARPISFVEKTTKWCRRHPSTAALIALVAVGIIAGVYGWARFTNQLANQTTIAKRNERAAKESLAAEVAAHAASNEMLTFLSNDLLDTAIKESGIERDLTVYDVVMDAGERIDGKFDNQPIVEATIRSTIGNALNVLGRYEDAIPYLERAVEIFDGTESARNTAIRAKHALAIASEKTKDYETAKIQVDQLLDGSYELLPQNELEIRLTYSNALLAGDPKPARKYIEQLLEDCEERFPEGHSVTADVLGQMGLIHHRSGNREKALELFQRAYDMSVEVSGPDHFDTLAIANNLALGLNRLGKFSESVAVSRDTYERKAKKLGPAHQSTLRSYRNLALGHWRLGERQQAIDELVDLLPRLQQVHGVTAFVSMATINEIANMKQIVESPAAAVEFLDQEFQPILGLQENESVWGQILLVYCQANLSIESEEAAQKYCELAKKIFENAENVNPAHLKKLNQLEQQIANQ